MKIYRIYDLQQNHGCGCSGVVCSDDGRVLEHVSCDHCGVRWFPGDKLHFSPGDDGVKEVPGSQVSDVLYDIIRRSF